MIEFLKTFLFKALDLVKEDYNKVYLLSALAVFAVIILYMKGVIIL